MKSPTKTQTHLGSRQMGNQKEKFKQAYIFTDGLQLKSSVT